MSIFGRLVAGAGAGVASIANKYIDASIAEQKAQMLADLQVKTAGRLDDQANDPARRARMRGEAVLDTTAAGTAKNATELAGKIAETSSPQLRQAAIENTQAMTPSLVDRAKQLDAVKPYELSPGQERYGPDGLIASNKRLTSQEVQDRLYREALKGERAKAAGAGDKPFKLDEDTKLLLTDLNKQQEKLQELIDKSSLDPITARDKDGNPNPALADLSRRVKTIELRKTRLLADAGIIDGAGVAADLLKANPTPDDNKKSIEQAKAIGGKFAAGAVPVFEGFIKGQFTVKNTPANAGPQPFSVQAGDKVPAQPDGILARAARRISDLGMDFTSEAGKAALAQRVQEAKAGGQPLSDTEQLRAQQAGLI